MDGRNDLFRLEKGEEEVKSGQSTFHNSQCFLRQFALLRPRVRLVEPAEQVAVLVPHPLEPLQPALRRADALLKCFPLR